MSDHKAGWTAALVVLGGIVILAHVAPVLDGSFIEVGIRDGLHVLGFAGVAAIVFQWAGGSLLRRSLVAIFATAMLGVTAESVQHFRGRQFDIIDLVRDTTGAVLITTARLLWIASMRWQVAGVARAGLRAVSVAVAILVAIPFVYWISVYAGYLRQLPVIVEFGNTRDIRLIRRVNSALVPDSGDTVLGLELQETRRSGVAIDVVARDWSAYETVVLRVAISGVEEAEIIVELSDGPHPGIRPRHLIGSLPADASMAELRFGLDEARAVEGRPPLDTENIERVWVLGRHRGGTAMLLLDKIWLE